MVVGFLVVAIALAGSPEESSTRLAGAASAPQRSISDSVLVLDGTPMTRVSASIEGDNRATLSEAERAEYRVVIVKRGDRFFWASRDNKELGHTVSGDFHIFYALDGSGYVKVTYLQSHVGAKPGRPSVIYMESLHQLLNTVTYWGGATELRI